MRKTWYILLAILATVTLVCLIIFSSLSMDDYPKFTNDMKDYGSNKYLLDSTIFLPTIPSNAQVVTFSYYNYWNEAKDIYLELKFLSKDEMEKYLADLNEHSLDGLKQYPLPTEPMSLS